MEHKKTDQVKPCSKQYNSTDSSDLDLISPACFKDSCLPVVMNALKKTVWVVNFIGMIVFNFFILKKNRSDFQSLLFLTSIYQKCLCFPKEDVFSLTSKCSFLFCMFIFPQNLDSLFLNQINIPIWHTFHWILMENETFHYFSNQKWVV